MSPSVDPAALARSWKQQWPELRPLGHELRGGDRWVRFHSLPDSKRYAESDAERSEILGRHNLVIEELAEGSVMPVRWLAVVTCSWSTVPGVGDGVSPEPALRDDALRAVSNNSTFWQSVLREVDEGEEWWTHLFVDIVPWRPGALDDLLLLVAEWKASDVIIGPTDFEWLYHPYDGGADVIATSTEQRDELKDRHRNWLPQNSAGL